MQRTPCESESEPVISSNCVPLSNVIFSILPDKLALKLEKLDSKPETSVQSVYEECYRLVFGKPAGSPVFAHTRTITDRSKQAKMPLRLFILTGMTAHKKKRETPFYPSMLTGPYSVKVAQKYREVCQTEYGGFSEHILGNLTGEHFVHTSLQSKMLASEVKAAIWIVGYKRTSPGLPYRKLYEAIETELDPIWLAIEPAYAQEVYDPYIRSADQRGVRESFRFQVSKVLGELKRSSSYALSAFQARQAVLPEALAMMLAHFRLELSDLTSETKICTNPLLLWMRIGLALQQIECLNYLAGEPSVIDHFFTDGENVF